MSALKTAAALAFCATLAFGCAGYKPGVGNGAQRERIWVAPSVNQSYMPQIAAVLDEKVRDSFLSAGTITLSNHDDAQARLEITVLDVSREGRASGQTILHVTDENGVKTVEETKDKGLDKSYDVTIKVRAILTENGTERVLCDREFEAGTQTMPSPYTMGSADRERLLMPVLARELARQIRDAITQGWDKPHGNG